MSIKIIGAGLPRTGTNTLKACLEQLGYIKTYHMKELLVNPEKLKYWQSLDETNTTDWDGLYEGFQASVDFPCYPWYKQHLERYPHAKVILTVRPFEKWYTSITSTIFKAGPQTLPEKLKMMAKLLTSSRQRKVVKCIKLAKKRIFQVSFQGKLEDKGLAEKLFHQHNEEVKAFVPADRLLVYDVRDGWGPLCAFLNLPEPSEPVPHLNKKENFKKMLPELMKGKMV